MLPYVEQLCLQVRAHFRDFIEENRALVGHFKLAGLAAHRAREGALLKAEKLRFQKFSRQRSTIYFHERLISTLRAQVNHSRNNFLPYPTLATNKNWHIHRRDLQDLLSHSHHLGAGRKKAQILGHLIAVIAQRLILRS